MTNQEMNIELLENLNRVANNLGGKYRATYRPLNEGIISGRLRGAAGIVGCNNTKIAHDFGHVEMAKELLKNDVIIVSTGCSAIADAKAGHYRAAYIDDLQCPTLRVSIQRRRSDPSIAVVAELRLLTDVPCSRCRTRPC